MEESSHLKSQNMATNISVQELYSEEKKTTIEDLLPELLLEIFAWLPVRSILRARGTCKLWNKIMKDHTFMHTHFERALKNPGYLVFLSDVYKKGGLFYHVGNVEGDTDSSDAIQLRHNTGDSKAFLYSIGGFTAGGLILYESWDSQLKDSILLVGNPFTGEYMKIPLEMFGNFCLMSIGFGYSPSTKEYKLIKLGLGDGRVIKGAVFTIGCSESWRAIPDVPYLPANLQTAVVFDGNIFWEISECHLKPCDAAGGKDTIMSFDVASECFRVWRGPPIKPYDISSGLPHPRLTQIDHSVAWVQWDRTDSIKVWILRADKKEEEWIQKYHIFPNTIQSSLEVETFDAIGSMINGDNTLLSSVEAKTSDAIASLISADTDILLGSVEREKLDVIGSWINGDLHGVIMEHGVIMPGYRHFSWNASSGEFKPLTSCFGERIYQGKGLQVESHVGTLMPLSELVSMARQFRRKGESGSNLPYDQPQ